jgi:hypothetical protein
MTNIDKIRQSIKTRVSTETHQETGTETSISPTGQFRLDATSIWLKESNSELTKIELYDQKSNEKVFDFHIDDSQYFYGWVTTNDTEYLISAEDIYGGQTIVDLTKFEIAGYSPNEDGFIWTDFYLSPDSKILASLGCYWACNTVVKLFDFTDPMKLPLTEIKEIELLGNDEIILGWLDNETLQMRGVKREQIPEYHESGGFSMRTIGEVKIERRINIKDGD